MERTAPERPGSVRQVTSSAEQTETLGESLAGALAPGDLIVLTGPLGSGKTRFVAGLARGLGAPSRVRSPSFTLLNEYRGAHPLFHLDLYRVEPADVDGLGLDELLEEGVLAAEWGEKLPRRFAADALILAFAILSSTERAITAEGAGARGRQLLSAWLSLATPEAR